MQKTVDFDYQTTSQPETSSSARIGPNALIQTVRALRETYDDQQVGAILSRAHLSHLLHDDPAGMVAESDFAALVTALTEALGMDVAHDILERSGQLTAAYLLVHRIPRPFQHLLRLVPRRVAFWLLLTAISQHAWTFVGSGTFTFAVGRETRLTVVSSITPAEAVSGFYGGTLQHLVHSLIDAHADTQTVTAPMGEQAACTYLFRSAQNARKVEEK